ncbi:MAG: DUF1826 domain-containing protein [Crocinitomicaceae bacterium]
MSQTISIKNWNIGSSSDALNAIHQSEINVAIQSREADAFSEEASLLIAQNINFRSSGDAKSILRELENALDRKVYDTIVNDVVQQLRNFEYISEGSSFKLMLATVTSDMCRKFHTDINDLRLLCTYSGPGTLWLEEDNIDRKALNSFKEDELVVIDQSQIQQANTGDVVILKGATYPKEGTRAGVHRSPSIEEYGSQRLLLRIDTNEFLTFLE